MTAVFQTMRGKAGRPLLDTAHGRDCDTARPIISGIGVDPVAPAGNLLRVSVDTLANDNAASDAWANVDQISHNGFGTPFRSARGGSAPDTASSAGSRFARPGLAVGMPQPEATVSDYTAILSGSSWSGTSGGGTPQFVTYSFSSSAQPYLSGVYSSQYIGSFQPFTADEADLARQALALWGDISGLVFLEAPAGEGDIQFGNFDFSYTTDYQNAGGFAYYPSVSITNQYAYQSNLGGDVFVNTVYPSDLTSLHLLVHEIGHAIGFKHPFEGDPVLPTEQDNWAYTVMSYTASGAGTTLGTYDVQAVQYLYGLQGADGSQVASWSWDSVAAKLTQVGTAGNDAIRGVYSTNNIDGGAGDDMILGGFEADTLNGGVGADSIYGNDGGDTINGGDGDDRLLGEAGNDTLSGGAGGDTIYGGDGGDTINGGADNDTLSGNAGDDTLSGDDGNDNIWGDDGNDTISGGAGNDYLGGGTGNDTIRPGLGNDTVYAGDGDDTISFSGGKFDYNDFVNGEAGNDLLYLNGDYSGANALVMYSSTLLNVENIAFAAGFNYSLTTSDATVAAGAQLSLDATVLGASNSLTFDGSLETNGTFVMLTGAGADTLRGGSGGDTFRPGGGLDHVYGNGGNDTFSFSLGHLDAADVIDGGSGTDMVWLNSDYTGGNALVMTATTLINVESISLSASYSFNLTTADATVAATQQLSVDASSLGASRSLTFNGSAETDGTFLVIGGAGTDVINGGAGNDTLSGRGGSDALRPGLGNDVASGGDGDDVISFTGGRLNAADIVDGGAGTDTVMLNGDYTGGNALTFFATTMTNVEAINAGAGFSYSLKTVDATVATGAVLNVSAAALGAANTLTFDGSAETNGTFTVTGGAGTDTVYGGSGNDTLSGRGGNDTLRPGMGNDTVSGDDGDDTISFTGGRFNAADVVNGGAGYDSVWLNGDYTGGNAVAFTATSMTNVESIGLAGGFNYSLTSNAATIASGKTLTVDAALLGAANALTFNGAAETDGAFTFVSGSGGDVLTGGLGADTFKYDAASRSTGLHYDTINALNFANDSFDIPGSSGVVTGVDAAKSTGTLSTASFDTDLAAALSGLGAHHAILFTPNAGSLSGQTFMVVDCNGTAGYQSGQDLVIRLNGYSGTLSAGAFH